MCSLSQQTLNNLRTSLNNNKKMEQREEDREREKKKGKQQQGRTDLLNPTKVKMRKTKNHHPQRCKMVDQISTVETSQRERYAIGASKNMN